MNLRQGYLRWWWWCFLGLIIAFSGLAGPLHRVPNTTLKMPASLPAFGFTATNAFPNLTFSNAVCITSAPGETNRLFILEKHGRIIVITNLASPTRTIFMDISSRVSVVTSSEAFDTTGEEGLLGLAFHPGYATNGFFYVFYTGQGTNGTGGLHDILSRFRVLAGNRNKGDPTTELKLFSQYDRASNHNGGDVHFGPDGYLYVSVGDEGAEHNSLGNGQRIDLNLFSGLLRIDVDKRPGGLTPNPSPTSAVTSNYGVPPGNPFVGATNFDNLPVNPAHVRTEFWAVGLRNPFRFSFDPQNGTLYCGDVGQDTYEEVDIIKKGGNYGWGDWEGFVSPPPNTSTNGQPVAQNPIPPIIAYAHGSATNQGNCIIGGVVYYGQKLSQLYGKYVYGDHVDGNVWAITYNGTNASKPQRLFSDPGISAFGTDPSNGDVLYANIKSGNNSIIGRIVYSAGSNGKPIPPTLAATGAFTNLMALKSALDPLHPKPGIVPYDINVPFWSDNAIKTRWFSVPNTNLTIGFNPTGNWTFPAGTVWIKHFNLQLTNGQPASQIRLETRLLVLGSNGIYGVTYRWGHSKTNATLVPATGMDEAFVINNGGILNTQVWHYPSQVECQLCHTPQGGYGLGFRTEQLNKNFTYTGGATNQINALSDAGYFSSPLITDVHTLLALANATNTAASLEFRARSYLMANCSQCHQPGGSAQGALWDARITTPTAQAGLVNGALDNNFGDPNNHVITPLSPSNSVLLTRISTRDLGMTNSIQMPPLDSTLVDTQAVSLITQWINSFPLSISALSIIDTNLVFSGSNGPAGRDFYLMGCSNIALPLSNWSWIPDAEGTFDTNGNFILTTPIDPSQPQWFYILQLP